MTSSNDSADRATIKVTPPSSWDTSSLLALLKIVREDIEFNSGGLLVPSIQMLAVHRLGEWAAAQPWPLRRICLMVFRLLNVYVRNVLGFEVSHQTKIGRRVKFVHQNGVVLQPNAEIGDECMIYHNVTIGRRWDDDRPGTYREPPRIGKRVHLGVGCTVIGAVQIGDDAKIGPHALVTTSVPVGASVVAPSSRILRLR
jgi:serine O-acetyltransferase